MQNLYQSQSQDGTEEEIRAKRHRAQSELLIAESDYNRGERKAEDLKFEISNLKKKIDEINENIKDRNEELRKIGEDQKILEEDIKKLKNKIKSF